MDESQLLKGILEACVLQLINRKETYGYEIITELAESGFDNIIEGTLYPVLGRLEKKKYIQCRKAKSPLGPIRKYYSITLAGEDALKEYKMLYKGITQKANVLLEIEK